MKFKHHDKECDVDNTNNTLAPREQTVHEWLNRKRLTMNF